MVDRLGHQDFGPNYVFVTLDVYFFFIYIYISSVCPVLRVRRRRRRSLSVRPVVRPVVVVFPLSVRPVVRPVVVVRPARPPPLGLTGMDYSRNAYQDIS